MLAPSRLARSLGSSLVLISASLIAHITNISEYRLTVGLFTQLLLVLILAVFFNKKELRGPKLALLVLICQSSIHFLIGGNSDSNTSMLISHGVLGLLSYYLITNFENYWNKVTSKFSLTKYEFNFIPQLGRNPQALTSDSKVSLHIFSKVNILRGPPNSALFGGK